MEKLKIERPNLIFDFDGTLVNSLLAIYNCTKAVIEQYPELIKTNLTIEEFTKANKSDLYHLFEALFPEINRDLLENMVKSHQSLSPNFFTKDILYTGILDFLFNLKQSGYRLFIATNNIKANVKNVFAFQEGLFEDIFSGIADYYSAEIGRQKPFPDMLNSLFNEYDFKPEDSVLIGDDIKDHDCAENINAQSSNNIEFYRVTWNEYLAPYNMKPEYQNFDNLDKLKQKLF